MGVISVVNWFTDGICLPIHERLDLISEYLKDDSDPHRIMRAERMVEQIRIILDSAGTERPPIEEEED